MPTNRKPYDEEEDEAEEGVVGHCKHCTYFDVDRDEDIADETIAACLHPDLEDYELRVSGDSSCNLHEATEEEDDDDDEDEEEGESEEY